MRFSTSCVWGSWLRRQAITSVDNDSTLQSVPTDGEIAAPSTSAAGLWDVYDSIVVHREQTSSEQIPKNEQQFATCLNQPRVPPTTDIYGYWNCSQFPDVESAAKKHHQQASPANKCSAQPVEFMQTVVAICVARTLRNSCFQRTIFACSALTINWNPLVVSSPLNSCTVLLE